LNRRILNEIARVGADDWEIAAAAPASFPGDLAPITLQRAPEERVPVYGIPVHFASRIHWMLYGRALRSLLRQPWDLVHCWEEPYILAGLQIAYWTPAVTPLVFYTFQNISKHYPPPFSWAEKYSVNRCAGWLAAASSVEQTLLTRGYDRRPHQVMPLAVDLDKFSPQPQWKRNTLGGLGWAEDGPPVVGYLGRFIEAKGIRLLARTLDALTVPWRALFVGGGELQGWLAGWARGQGDRVRIVTSASHDQVPKYLNAMDILCAPSQTTPAWREQFGRMLIEAFACGVPVIASDSGEIPHVVGDAGIILSENDHQAWGAAIERLINLPCERKQMATKGLERVQHCYSLERVAMKHLAFFTDILRR